MFLKNDDLVFEPIIKEEIWELDFKLESIYEVILKYEINFKEKKRSVVGGQIISL